MNKPMSIDEAIEIIKSEKLSFKFNMSIQEMKALSVLLAHASISKERIELVRERAQLSEGWIPTTPEERRLMKLCVELAESRPTMDAEEMAKRYAQISREVLEGFVERIENNKFPPIHGEEFDLAVNTESMSRLLPTLHLPNSVSHVRPFLTPDPAHAQELDKIWNSLSLPKTNNLEDMQDGQEGDWCIRRKSEIIKAIHRAMSNTFYPLIGDMGELLEALVPHLSISELSEITGDSRKTVQATIRLLSISPLPSDEEITGAAIKFDGTEPAAQGFLVGAKWAIKRIHSLTNDK